jgi:hypothetical protein
MVKHSKIGRLDENQGHAAKKIHRSGLKFFSSEFLDKVPEYNVNNTDRQLLNLI